MAITSRNLGQVSNKNLYIIRNNGTVYRSPEFPCVSFGEAKKFLILSFTKPVYKTINHQADKLSCVCPWFLSINQTRPTHGLSLISSVFKTKRIAAIRRINLRFNERKKKSTTRFYRLRSLSSSCAKNMHGFEWKKSGKFNSI